MNVKNKIYNYKEKKWYMPESDIEVDPPKNEVELFVSWLWDKNSGNENRFISNIRKNERNG